MGRRIVVVAMLSAAVIVAAGVAAWEARLRAVRAVFDTQVAIAPSLMAAAKSASELEHVLARSELRVVVEDQQDGVAYDDDDGAFVERPLPPPGPQGMPLRPPPQPLSRFLGATFGRQPQRIDDGNGLAVVVAPNLAALGRFLIADATLTSLLLVFVIGGAVWIVMGLTRATRKELEDKLEERRVAAAEYQRFLADAGHELRTPLTIVSGYVEILGNEPSHGRDAKILEGLRAETARMRTLVEKMLVLARLDSPVSIPRFIDVASAAGQVAAQMRARYPQRQVTVHAEGNAAIVIDADDLHEALRNLVENALRYAPSSPVEIEAKPVSGAAVISVTDRGEGVSASEREKIFQRFYRGSLRTDGEGSGLGLAIVARVAERWNGEVVLDSRPGHTTFTLRFPLAEEEPA